MTLMIESFTITCCHSECGLTFSVPKRWEEERRRDHTSFYCPNGHSQHFASESAEEKLRRERDRLKQDIARADDEARVANIRAAEATDRAKKAEAKAKRLTKRAAAGTCACCHRTFGDLAEHMKRQHPEFVEATGAKVIPIKAA